LFAYKRLYHGARRFASPFNNGRKMFRDKKQALQNEEMRGILGLVLNITEKQSYKYDKLLWFGKEKRSAYYEQGI